MVEPLMDYEDTMRRLSRYIREAEEHAKAVSSLEEKLRFQRVVAAYRLAWKQLRTHYYSYVDISTAREKSNAEHSS